MGIWGIAATNSDRPIDAHELEAMCSVPVGTPVVSRMFPQAGFCEFPGASSGALWFSDRLIVACDADLHNPERAIDRGIAQWIAGLYLVHDDSFLHKLRGAFALAIWDQKNRTLLLAVDRFGIKRLCYAQTSSGIVFATQPSWILASRRVVKKVNLSAITDYLVYNVVPGPNTAFEGISRLTPGEYVLCTDNVASRKRYWDMRYPEDAQGSTPALADELSSRMEAAVRITSADLNLSKAGCFLSGGTDSSSIVGFLTQLHKTPANAFSIGFSEDRFNELEYARLAARHFQAHHVEGVLGPDDARGVIEKIVGAYDEPFGNSSAIPTYLCAKLARERGIETLLAGDGGDELFGGNERYVRNEIFHAYQKLPRPLRSWLIEPAVSYNPLKLNAVRKAQNYIRRSNTANPDRYCQWRLLQVFPPEVVLGTDMPFRNGHSDLLMVMRAHYNGAPASSELNRLLYVDVKMTLGDDDLPKVTRTAELAGLKVRFPYLDHELAEFTGRLPARLKVHNLEKRYLFKIAMRKLLPPAILRKKKHGFGLPIGFWLKSDPKLHGWAKDVLFDPTTYQRGYFRRDFIEKLFANLQEDDTPYFGDLLWVFLMLELWHRRHVEGSPC
jgi:asparagine synthase (glutamine-hydrolysing)